MTNAELIYDAIPDETRVKFIKDFLVLVGETVEVAELCLPHQEKVKLLTALGNAGAEGDYQAMFEAFGRLVVDL